MELEFERFNSNTAKLIYLYVISNDETDPIKIAETLDISILTVYALIDTVLVEINQ